MQNKITETENFGSWVKRIDILYFATGFTIIVSFLGAELAILFIPIPDNNRELFIHLLGIIEGSFVTGLVGFFFVNSKKQPNADTGS